MISVDKQIRTQVSDQLNNKLYDIVVGYTNIPIRVQIIKLVRNQVYAQIFLQVYDKVRQQVAEEIP
jgi:hypothetical protein